MNKIIYSIFVITFVFVAFTSAQNRGAGNSPKQNAKVPDKRFALVIGNGNYGDSPLKNPVNDATDLAAALRDANFNVVMETNLTQNDMKRAIRKFGQQLRASGGIGLFYFAGHGVQAKGTNYLIPIGANIDTEEEVEYEAVEAGFVLAQMESAQNELNIVILDACRNNPFARSFRSTEKGLAQMDAPSGTLIAYATAPGSVASDGTSRNGLYTQELLKNMRTPNLSIEEVFKRVRVSVRGATANKQTPWESSSLVGYFTFTSNIKKDERTNNRIERIIQKSGGVIKNGNFIVTYAEIGRNIVFTLELTNDLTNNLSDEYPRGDFAGITVDVNGNDIIDRYKDVGYGIVKNEICSYYLVDAATTTGCNTYKSKASVIAAFKGTAFESRPHPVYEYTIPKTELSENKDEANVQFKLFSGSNDYYFTPLSEQRADSDRFGAVEKVKINF